MPFLKIQTNQPLAEDTARQLAKKASALVATQLGKPESYVMTSVENNPAMTFAGTEEPLAFLELKSIGLPESSTAGTSAPSSIHRHSGQRDLTRDCRCTCTAQAATICACSGHYKEDPPCVFPGSRSPP